MTLSYKQISAQKLVKRRHYHIIDIRSEEERRDELGFIPGSLFAPSGEMLGDVFDLIPEEDALVLSCMTGSRSTACIMAQLQAGSTRTLYNLEGGLLEWIAQGFPVATFTPQEGHVHPLSSSPEEFFTQMRACFVGEVVEVIVEQELDLNPVELLQTSAQLAQVHHNGMPFEERLVDFAGYVSWQVGTPLEHIAQNMSWALANRHLIAETNLAEVSW